jgi:hypothetical protein
MTYCRKTLMAKREVSLVRRVSFRSVDSSHLTLHQQHRLSQAGR